jgi:hypothetical protein
MKQMDMEALKEMQKSFKEWQGSYDDMVRETWQKTPEEIKLAITAYVFRALKDHMKEGGTYRYLIYDRLGFGPEAYTALYVNGGMDLSNALFEERTRNKEEE